jgi:hypothetical protein
MPKIAENIGRGQTQEIINIEMRLRIDFLESHRFTAIAIEHILYFGIACKSPASHIIGAALRD